MLLHVLGATDDAKLAFATIGKVARVGGQVALASRLPGTSPDLGRGRGPEMEP